MNGKREYGDYQTPLNFATQICEYLKDEKQINPDVVFEPTCGIGNFLKSSLVFDAKKYYGIEINNTYCNICKEDLNNPNIEIINSDFFGFDLKTIQSDNLLVIGNPPWVTNSTLSSLGSDNLPQKENFKKLKGIDALTGSSNFDICEYIILHLIYAFSRTNTTIAMLCKTTVARNVFSELKRQNICFAYCEIVEFDANKIFGISANACLLLIKLSNDNSSPEICNIYKFDEPKKIQSSFGYKNGHYYSNMYSNVDDYDGNCCFEWRQGVKHDCSKVMELILNDGFLINGNKEKVEIEHDIVYPLVKSSMFKKPILDSFSKYVIVTQKKSHEETEHLSKEVPLTWAYLKKNKELFDSRKSSIYRNAPDFSMFGVGDYSYSKYKVGVSGFYKEPLFAVLVSKDGKPVMTDDTSYFICFPTYNTAYTAMLILNSPRVQSFLKSIAFLDAKRPYTKKVLERINFSKILATISIDDLIEVETRLGLEKKISENILNEFIDLPEFSKVSI